jgi:hypothetical protein
MLLRKTIWRKKKWEREKERDKERERVSLNAFEKQYKGKNVALSTLLNFGGKKGKQF